MNTLRILTTAQVRALEAAWIKHCHENWGMVLMEIAGLGASKMLLELMEGMPAAVTIICGKGNNGGDGLVVARHLLRAGVEINIFVIGSEKDKYSEDHLINRRILEAMSVEIYFIDDKDLEPLKASISDTSAIVDAILGTGLDRNVEGITDEIIDIINESARPVLAIDLPSGLNSDTGQIMGNAVQAAATATFGSVKPGLLCHPGNLIAGEIRLIDIGIPLPEALPEEMIDALPQLEIPRWWLATAFDVSTKLPERPVDSHKGTFGQILLVAGSVGMSGAAIMSARASLRSGAGMAILATAKTMVPSLPAEEIIYRPISETTAGSISMDALKELEHDMERAQVMVIGPGLSSNEETINFIHELLKKVRVPCVVDADGLNAIAKNPKIMADTEGGFVFTPHPKELSRLMGKPTEEIQSDRIRSAQEAAKRFGATIVLKGANTIVATPDDDVFIIPTGNNGMATAGSGDVLTGTIAGLLAQGLNTTWAAVAGAYIHGASGDLAAAEFGEDGIVAGDILSYIPLTIKVLRDGSFPGSALERSIANVKLETPSA
ncbi:MAG: NAD(P)H-hydrate dehydratase [Candidatus Obscuribacterales bacterium]|jgi:NAD(P)H-hydrate epimerase|nr:NAD(P)H-hydrate dehydratase [Candidatus Obscuribacterales bacterium]